MSPHHDSCQRENSNVSLLHDKSELFNVKLSFLFQIVPFVALGLGVQDIFLLTQTYAEQSAREAPPEVSFYFLIVLTFFFTIFFLFFLGK